MNYVEPVLPERDVGALGYECDSEGRHCRRWGFLPRSSEIWMGKDREQRNARFRLEPSGKT